MKLHYSNIRKYKYRVEATEPIDPYFRYKTKLIPKTTLTVPGEWLRLWGGDSAFPGMIEFRSGYTWDGPSGPTFDTKNWMRASLVHDGFYQLIREGFLPQSDRKIADRIMHSILLEDGMSKTRAGWSYLGVRVFGKWAANPKKSIAILSAP